MQNFINKLKQLTKIQQASIGAAALVILGIALYLIIANTNGKMEILYRDLEMEDSGKITSALEAQQIPFELANGGSVIKVPEKFVLSARVNLAKDGLPAKGSVIGYEIFDQEESLGTTSFLQNIKLVRALEGELTRTIMALDGIEKARVHLVIPQKEVFSKDKIEPKASVMIKLKSGKILNKKEIEAIGFLLSSSAPSLELKNVTIVDTKGRAMKMSGSDDDTSSASNDERKLSFESKMKKTIEELLEKSLGAGKVKAEVTAEMNFDKIVTTSEIFDPDNVVARSSQLIQDRETNSSSNTEVGVSVSNNIPGESNSDTTSDSGIMNEKTDETTNYEISKTIKNHIYETGILQKLSVAVLVDGVYTKDADGKQIYASRSAEELKIIENIVKTAIGYNEVRKDLVEVYNMQFPENLPEESQAVLSFLDVYTSLIIKISGVAITLLLILSYYVKPLLTRMLDLKQAELNKEKEKEKEKEKMDVNKLNEMIKGNIRDSALVLQKWINQG